MTTITFKNGGTIQAQEVVPTNQEGMISIGSGHDWDIYDISDIKSIMPDMSIPYKDRPKAPTKLQEELIKYLQAAYMYKWDKKHSTAAAAVILKRADGDFWLFGLEGEIMHNPEALVSIKL